MIQFCQALEQAKANGKAHLLLGNGFSRACRNDIFAYNALFNRADFNNLSPNAREAFNRLGTTDFEIVMQALRQAASLAELYQSQNTELAQWFRSDADGLREVLVSAIANSHPARPADISDESYDHCRQFLSNFDRIYSLNYDLLLYWALMQKEIEPEVTFDDGFRKPDQTDAAYVVWQ